MGKDNTMREKVFECYLSDKTIIDTAKLVGLSNLQVSRYYTEFLVAGIRTYDENCTEKLSHIRNIETALFELIAVEKPTIKTKLRIDELSGIYSRFNALAR